MQDARKFHTLNNPPPLHQACPAVSVIIPLYNAEKYIGECLDSILAQTFQNFEVIVVDDCSTDGSAAIVESYMPRFSGRLTLTKTQKNSGSPGEPGNMGMRFSRGEYFLVLDNDDAITSDALEKLYTTAKDFDADVVSCEKNYEVPTEFFGDAEYLNNLEPSGRQNCDCVSTPTLLENDYVKRITDCAQEKFLWPIWSKLIRRDFAIKNDLYFADNLIQDMLFTCCLIFSAERFVRVPYVVNRWRLVNDSLSHKQENLQDYIRRYLHALNTGFEYLDKFLSVRPFFQQRPDLRYVALDIYVHKCLWYFARTYGSAPAHVFEEIFRREVAKENLSTALTAVVLNKANIFHFNYLVAQARIAELENENKQLKSKE